MRLQLVTLLMITSSPAFATFYTYSEWDRMSPENRASYIAGSLDTLIRTASPDEKHAPHYHKCLQGMRVTTGQISENIRDFAKANPEYQRHGPQYAMINYLVKVCGMPPE